MTSTLTLQGISTFVSIFSYLFSGYIMMRNQFKQNTEILVIIRLIFKVLEASNNNRLCIKDGLVYLSVIKIQYIHCHQY